MAPSMRWLSLSYLLLAAMAYPIHEDDDDDDSSIETDRVQKMMFDIGYIDLSQYGSRIFGYPDNTTGQRLAQYDYDGESLDQNPEELGSYLEGDILMPLGQARNGLTASGVRWKNGIVPYVIRGNFDEFQMNMLKDSFNEYHTKTCIRFKPRTRERDYIVLMNGKSGCWSSVGRIGGRQEVNLQTPGCMRKIGTVIHELMHVCGFLHEHNREERDDFVTINWSNVRSGLENNFQKARSFSTSAYGVRYDYNSVMHYSATAFTRNGRPTISAKLEGPSFGQRDGFSDGDIAKLNSMYKCSIDSPPPDPPTMPPSSVEEPEPESELVSFRDHTFGEYNPSYDDFVMATTTPRPRTYGVSRYYPKRYKTRSRVTADDDDDRFVRLIL